jgi:FKBP-type peptidyl-prolyl cis-trans isomerase FkpA
MQRFILVVVLLFSISASNAQFLKLKSGIEYRYFKKGTGKQTANPNDFMSMILKSTCSGKVIFDSKNFNKGVNAPVNFPIQKPKFNGDVMEVLRLLHEGDSVLVKIPQDSFYRVPQAQRNGMTPGEPVFYNIGVFSIKTPAQIKKLQDDYNKQVAVYAKYQADAKKQQQAQLLLQKKQAVLDKNQDQLLKGYFAKSNYKNPIKLPSGVYVVLDEEGTGDFIKPGFEVTMNYDKYALNGPKYDSNTDTAFKHTTPLKVNIGQRQLISGWEDGLKEFKKGSKGKIFIPSKYAYGSNKFGIRPNDTIPSNSVILVEVEVLDVVDVATVVKQLVEKEDNEIQAFLKANNLNATKTNSGLYYVITSEGKGDKPAMNDEVTMNYTGMFLDGNKFDSNIDSAFGHVSPFNFPLGVGRVIRGWDEGVALLKKGTKAKLILPSAIAYGANGSGKIPANSVLQFDVELVDFKKPVAPAPAAPQVPSKAVVTPKK